MSYRIIEVAKRIMIDPLMFNMMPAVDNNFVGFSVFSSCFANPAAIPQHNPITLPRDNTSERSSRPPVMKNSDATTKVKSPITKESKDNIFLIFIIFLIHCFYFLAYYARFAVS